MRPIKFCGSRNIDGAMIFGWLITDDYGNTFISDGGNGWHQVKHESVGQFTGKYDATKFSELTKQEQGTFLRNGNNASDWHGKEIYENNVLAFNDTIYGFVYFDEERAQFMIDTSIAPLGGHGKQELGLNASLYKVIDFTYKHPCEESKI